MCHGFCVLGSLVSIVLTVKISQDQGLLTQAWSLVLLEGTLGLWKDQLNALLSAQMREAHSSLQKSCFVLMRSPGPCFLVLCCLSRDLGGFRSVL